MKFSYFLFRQNRQAAVISVGRQGSEKTPECPKDVDIFWKFYSFHIYFEFIKVEQIKEHSKLGEKNCFIILRYIYIPIFKLELFGVVLHLFD